jgi:hypothetical protein
VNGDISMAFGGQTIDMTMKMKARQTTTISDKNPVVD